MAIERLHDVSIEDIEHLPRDALLRLCAFHGLKTTHKKEKGEGNKKRKGKGDALELLGKHDADVQGDVQGDDM